MVNYHIIGFIKKILIYIVMISLLEHILVAMILISIILIANLFITIYSRPYINIFYSTLKILSDINQFIYIVYLTIIYQKLESL